MRGRLLKTLFGTAGVVFLVAAFLDTWDRSAGLLVVGPGRLALASVAVFLSLHAGLHAWASLVGAPARSLGAGFFTSQLGKYVPGGVWQAVGQVGYATSETVSVERATVAFATFAVTQAVSGTVVASAIVLAPGDIPGWIRALAALGPLATLVLRRRWLVRPVGLVARLRGTSTIAEDVVPPQAAIYRSTLWGAGSLVAVGTAFALVLPVSLSAGDWLTVCVAFVAAWTVGFLAIPVPAGVGVREGVLLLTLGHVADTSVLVAASVVLRLLAMTTELVAIAASRVSARRRSRPRRSS